ncbi:MAG TPA: serine/threonine-protein kinase, partial [Chloroflexota bacterium]|nr:serine/threonine-protein kinase [Chloroflexota bacterium]
QDLVQSSSPLPLDRALNILGQLADALDYAHGRGVVHRDVKASNVIIGPGDRVTLLDFGIARAAAGSKLTRTGVIVGTPEYLAPEAITGDASGPSTDLYALGVVAHELIAGRVPFPGLDTPAMLYAQAHRPPPRPRGFRSDLPEAVEQVLMRQLAKLPAARYSSAGGFVAALFAALSSSPTRPDLEETDEAPTIMRAGPPTPVMERAAPPKPPGPPLAKPPRHRVQLRVWSALAAALLAVGGLFGVFLVGRGLLPPGPEPTPTLPTSTPVLTTATPAVTLTPVPATATQNITQPTPIATPEALLSDDFKNPASGRLDKSSSDPSHFTAGYVGGEYMIRTIDPEYGSIAKVQLPGTYADAALAVDARLVDSATSRYVVLGCRAQPTVNTTHYRLAVSPEDGMYTLERWDNGKETTIVPWQASAAIKRGTQTNRLELSCAGTAITAAANGAQLASVQDSTYSQGALLIAASSFPNSHLTVDARFDNLAVTSTRAAAQITPSPGPEALPLFDDFKNPASGRLPASSSDPNSYALGYVDGEYMIRTIAPDAFPIAFIPGTYTDTSLAVDARLVGSAARRYLALGCRREPNVATAGEYEFVVTPEDGMYMLARWDNGKQTLIVPWQASAAIKRGTQANRLELSCAGTTVTVLANGTQLASVQDNTYRQGRLWIGAASFPDSHLTVDARFDNLAVTKR